MAFDHTVNSHVVLIIRQFAINVAKLPLFYHVAVGRTTMAAMPLPQRKF